MSTRKVKAWLVTWEWCGDHAKRDDNIAAILIPRLRSQRVRQIVEFIYLSQYTLSERMAYMIRPDRNPYAAKFLNLEGSEWEGEIQCGGNPYLRARSVYDFTIELNEQGKETATWKDRYKVAEVRQKIASIRNV